jgi:hypothetical protein
MEESNSNKEKINIMNELNKNSKILNAEAIKDENNLLK